MAYNGYPGAYQPVYWQPQYQQAQPQQQQSGLIWVQGEAGAKSYMVSPDSTVVLWDSETQAVYIKSADASGMPSMKILDYTLRDQSAPQISAGTYATKEDIEGLKKQIDELKAKLGGEGK